MIVIEDQPVQMMQNVKVVINYCTRTVHQNFTRNLPVVNDKYN